MVKAIFLDRDGNVNVEPEDEIVDSIKEVQLFPNTIPALKLLMKTDFKLFFITNQVGISLGRLTIKKFHKINNYILNQVEVEGIKIEKTYFCPHSPKDKCNCRKPGPGMLEKAAEEYNIDLSKSYVIGDRQSDILLGKKAGCKTIWVKTGFEKSVKIKPDYEAKDLLEAVKYILKSLKSDLA
jgi:histidinol-phosphate phosphatase family protein